METIIKERFIKLWKTYFDNAELPITFYYTDEERHASLGKQDSGLRCIIAALAEVRKGTPRCFDVNSIGCAGGKRYLGFADKIMPNFEYFLSCGIPNKLEGERYKKSPDLVKSVIRQSSAFKAPGRFIIFKKWDILGTSDNPDVVIFFAVPDVLSGLFTLANFDEAEQNAVTVPFGSGCSTIVQYPYLEKLSEHPRGVIGMFDVSARSFIQKDVLTFSVPFNKFQTMVDNMEESFLITSSWTKLKKRIAAD